MRICSPQLGAALGALLFAWPSVATAQALPAVSALNGRLDLSAGALKLPTPGFVSHAAGALALPLGEQFGLQAELGVGASRGFSSGGTLHLFTRDPQSHLVGGAFSALVTPGATVLAAGPEAELYFDRWTLEAWGGLTYTRPAAGPERIGGFVRAGIAAYPTDTLRLSLGLSHFDGYNALHAGGEYLLGEFGLPVSLTAEVRLGQDGAVRAAVGLRGHIGGAPKSLIRRHREDLVAPGGALLASLAAPALFSAPVAPPALARQSPPDNREVDGAPPPTEPDVPPPDDKPPPGKDDPPQGDDGSGDGEVPADGDGPDGPDPAVEGPACPDAFEVYNPETGACEFQ